MSTTTRTIYLVKSKGEKIKGFGSRGLADEYKDNFCKEGIIEEINLFEVSAPKSRYQDEDAPAFYGFYDRIDPSDYNL